MSACTHFQDYLLPGTSGWLELRAVISQIDLLMRDSSDLPQSENANLARVEASPIQLADKVTAIREKFSNVTENPGQYVRTGWVRRTLRLLAKPQSLRPEAVTAAPGATWADLYEAQRIRLILLSPESLEYELCHLKTSFKLYAGRTLLAHYHEATSEIRSKYNTPTPSADAPGKSGASLAAVPLRAEAMFLLEQIQDIQSYRPHQERKRLSISYCVLRTTFYFIVMVALLAWVFSRTILPSDFPTGLFMILSLGALGAAFSSLQRIQRSYREGAMILNSTRYMRKFKDWISPPVTGAVFALVACLLFYGGFVAKLVPTENPQNSQSSTPSDQRNGRGFLRELFVGEIERKDFIMILLLAFMAGFAERLVPDTLDRLSGANTARKGNGDEPT
jgi:hypothetical protein